jgi:cysteine-rich repeat protein
MGVFLDAVVFPASPFPGYAPPSLMIKTGSDAVDKGVVIPNVNDGFAGAAPDLGAYEAGSALPTYGPRTSETASTCGNGDREGAEECDGGNTAGGDGCSNNCRLESTVDGGNIPDAPTPPTGDAKGKPPEPMPDGYSGGAWGEGSTEGAALGEGGGETASAEGTGATDGVQGANGCACRGGSGGRTPSDLLGLLLVLGGILRRGGASSVRRAARAADAPRGPGG